MRKVPPPENDLPRLVYDGECAFCRRSAAVAMALAGQHIESAPSTEALVAMRLMFPDGSELAGAAAAAWVWRHVPVVGGLADLYHLPVVRRLADAAYGWIARHRYQFSRLFGGECRGSCRWEPPPSSHPSEKRPWLP